MNAPRSLAVLDGFVAGGIGYAVVVVYFTVLNLLQGRSAFHTAALLGGHLFYGVNSPADVVVAPGPVLAYNGAHLLFFLAAGSFMAWLARLAERIPDGWYLFGGLFLIVMPHVFGLPLWFAEPVRGALAFWHVVAGTSIAALAMGAYLLASHPLVRADMRRDGRE